MFSQIDRGKEMETDLFNYTPDNNSNEQQLSHDFSSPLQKKGETKTLFGSLGDIAKKFPKHGMIKEEEERGMANKEMDKDILVKKYWYGKDVSVTKLKTKLELGRVETNTKRIRIECRDYSYVDGDRVRVYLNEKVIRTNIVLQGGYYTININLKEGFNRIDIEALNQGTSGPNTAEFNVFDENGNILATKEWNILTGYIATLIVEKN
ncbi:MAG: hypothetical protein L3J08_01715 [Flavobacteriaceae bacterium]|nr:hypothetical protein [Flavobacteriaceae bacterium]